jgi:hypothetical protein
MGLANWGYRSSSSNTIIGDVLVSVIGLPYLGQSVKFWLFPPNGWSFGALTLGYNAHPEKLLHAPPALQVARAGSVISLIGVILNIPLFIFMVIIIFFRRKGHEFYEGNSTRDTWSPKCTKFAWVSTAFTYLGSWFLWAGFLYSAGDLYCPGPLSLIDAIWFLVPILTSLLRVLL